MFLFGRGFPATFFPRKLYPGSLKLAFTFRGDTAKDPRLYDGRKE